MPIIKHQTQKQYYKMSSKPFQGSGLKLPELGLLGAFFSLKENWKFSIRGMAAYLHIGKATIETSLKHLQTAGYVRISSRHDEKGHFTDSIVEVFDAPQDFSTLPVPSCSFAHTEQPYPISPDTGLPAPVFHAQSINKKTNIEKVNKEHARSYEIKRISHNRFNNFEQRTYDYDDLEAKLLRYSAPSPEEMAASMESFPGNEAPPE